MHRHWHANSVITNPKPHAGSYDDLEVRRLSAFVMKRCDMPKAKNLYFEQATKRIPLAAAHAASGSARKNLFNESSDDDDDGVCKVGEQNDEQDDDCVEIIARTNDIVDGRVDTPSKNADRGLIGGSYQISRKEWELSYDPAFEILNKEVFKDPEEQIVTLNERVETSKTILVKATEKSKDIKKKSKSLSKALDQFTAKATRSPWELLSLPVNVGSERGLRLNRNEEQLDEVIKKISKFVPGAQDKLAKATPLIATIKYPYMYKVVDHIDRPLSALTNLESDRLIRQVLAYTSRVVVVSPLSLKELTVTLASPPRELVSKDIPSSFKANEGEKPLKEQNEEWVDALVDDPDEEMVDASADTPVEVVVQGIILQVAQDAS
nr:hypothetical protein [Tanacetum cinerariifolium]